MAFSGGTYTLPGAALTTGGTVSATDHNQVRNDMATAFNLTWLRNGTAVATANIPMGSYKLTGLGAGTTAGDAVRYEQTTLKTGSTASSALPSGTTAERDGSPAAGYIRFNSDNVKFEGYNGTTWTAVGGGATGGGTDQVFVENGQTVTANYTLSTNKNAMSAGPISIDSGITVTIPTGSVWVVL